MQAKAPRQRRSRKSTGFRISPLAVSYTHLDVYKRQIFPEIEYDKVDKVRGMDISFVTTAKTDEEARELLTLFNMPFAK